MWENGKHLASYNQKIKTKHSLKIKRKLHNHFWSETLCRSVKAVLTSVCNQLGWQSCTLTKHYRDVRSKHSVLPKQTENPQRLPVREQRAASAPQLGLPAAGFPPRMSPFSFFLLFISVSFCPPPLSLPLSLSLWAEQVATGEERRAAHTLHSSARWGESMHSACLPPLHSSPVLGSISLFFFSSSSPSSAAPSSPPFFPPLLTPPLSPSYSRLSLTTDPLNLICRDKELSRTNTKQMWFVFAPFVSIFFF